MIKDMCFFFLHIGKKNGILIEESEILKMNKV